jgi:hypothetical protein
MSGQLEGEAQNTDGPDGCESIRHKANAITAGVLLAIVMLLLAVGACTGGWFLVKRHVASVLAPAAFIAAAFFLLSAAVLPLALFREGCIEEDEDRKCKKDCDVLEDALDGIRNRTLSGLG